VVHGEILSDEDSIEAQRKKTSLSSRPLLTDMHLVGVSRDTR
jgi:hypothetical protein